jgi:immune inhibitor A
MTQTGIIRWFFLALVLGGLCGRGGVPGPTPTPTIPATAPWGTPTPAGTPDATETLRALLQADPPVRDLRDLAVRYLGLPPDTPETACRPERDLPLGARQAFLASNNDTNETFTVTAVLREKTPHAYLWVEEGRTVDPADLRAAAEIFEQRTYPTVREFFGSEWTPGVDCDPHLFILHAGGLGGVAGYYASKDEFPRAVRTDSNEAEMFYINLDSVSVNSDFYHGVLAHEFQHMIHWYHDELISKFSRR